jgi:hypothetical protein
VSALFFQNFSPPVVSSWKISDFSGSERSRNSKITATEQQNNSKNQREKRHNSGEYRRQNCNNRQFGRSEIEGTGCVSRLFLISYHCCFVKQKAEHEGGIQPNGIVIPTPAGIQGNRTTACRWTPLLRG